MSLTLQLVSNSIEFKSSTATIFEKNLRQQPSSTSTLIQRSRLCSLITPSPSPPPQISKVICRSTIWVLILTTFYDGLVIVYAIDKLFNLSFLASDAPQEPVPDQPSMSFVSGVQSPSSTSSAIVNYNMEAEPYRPGPKSLGFITDLLRSKRYAIFATFLMCS
ncbi:hypothetical protein C1H46_015596 [Malus baccata]|uniref:Uncharacterized protein n=1 Tax=Malus baccata TaxID=106549 RepID=A0A540MJ25_MALBA|nr:hypothetical protein C1H46_015596 [Malus baccata]